MSMAPSVVVAIHAPCWPGDLAGLGRSKRKSSRMFSATSPVEEMELTMKNHFS